MGDTVRITRTIGKQTIPDIKIGPRAHRRDRLASRVARLAHPRVDRVARRAGPARTAPGAVVSSKHYINLGGSEMVVYRVTPADVTSGVLVGDLEYPGLPGVWRPTIDGVKLDDPALRIAFFALRWDQDLNTPIRLFARDEAGNTARADFDHTTFPKVFKKSRIELDDKFLDRVVPAILAGTTEVKPEGDNLAKFLVINGELRRKNAEKIASFAKQTRARDPLARRVFHPFTNNAVESAFAD